MSIERGSSIESRRGRVSCREARHLALAAGLALAVVFSSGLAAHARGAERDGPERGSEETGEMISQYADELGLDDETLATIREIISSTRERGRALHFEREEAHRRLKFMLSLDEPDETAVLEQATMIGRIRIEESKHRLSTLLKIRRLLTPEQRSQLAELRRSEPREQVWGDVRTDCEADIQRLCPEVERGRATHECMRSHRDELSEECRGAVQNLRRRHSPRGHSEPGEARLK